MQVDLPALERPTNAISGTSNGGKKCSSGAVVKNFAVCSQPKAMVAGLFSPVTGVVSGLEIWGGVVLVVMDDGNRPEAPL